MDNRKRQAEMVRLIEVEITEAQTKGRHDPLRIRLRMAALPLDVTSRLLGSLEASERAYHRAHCPARSTRCAASAARV